MPPEQMVLSRELLALMRRSVTYAFTAQSDFVQAPHVLLSVLDDESLGPAVAELIPRDRIEAAPPRQKPPDVIDDPDSPNAPFPSYRSLMFRTPDGKDGKWLDAEAYQIFLEGARRVQDGPYLPKHLMHAYVSESNSDRGLLAILGPNPAAVADAVYAL